MRKLRLKAFAKVNLFLEVPRRRPDGYHDVETLFARISLADLLTAERLSRPGLEVRLKNSSNLSLAGQRDNIVYKAAEAFFREFRLEPSVRLTLEKRTPVGAGLGGGSADAAAALEALRRLYGISAARAAARLKKIAGGLGADVPFFLLPSNMAIGRGIGDRLTPLKGRARMPALVLVYPGKPVYTKEAYAGLGLPGRAEAAANSARLRRLARSLAGGGRPDWGELLFNRFEETVFAAHPEVARAKADLLGAGCFAALMSGSGACVFGLASSPAAARSAAARAKKRGRRVFVLKFC